MGSQDDDIIEGWKEIAAELGGVSPRTAQRYRRKLGLPVKDDVSGVYMRRAELRRWLVSMGNRRAA